MALAILDGAQTATTLSSVVTGGEHIVAHSVVSLGSNAISNITTAISGSTVCVGNLGLLQSTVATEGLSASGSFIKIGGHTGTSTTGNIVHVSAVGALRVDGSVYTQPISIASVTIGNTVTIGSLPAISGTVTANAGANVATAFYDGIYKWASNEGGDGSKPIYVGLSGVLSGLQDGDGTTFGVDRDFPISAGFAKSTGAVPMPTQAVLLGFGYDSNQNFTGVNDDAPLPVQIYNALPAGTNRIGVVTIGGGTVTIGAGTSQIGSVTASISSFATSVTARLINPAGTAVTYAEVGTAGNPSIDVLSVQGVTAGTPINVYPMQGTTVSNTNFTSTTASTSLVSAVTGREVLTVFNEGAGNLHISPGATATTISYQVRLSAGDYWECPAGQLSLAHSAVFATAGTARVTQVS